MPCSIFNSCRSTSNFTLDQEPSLQPKSVRGPLPKSVRGALKDGDFECAIEIAKVKNTCDKNDLETSHMGCFKKWYRTRTAQRRWDRTSNYALEKHLDLRSFNINKNDFPLLSAMQGRRSNEGVQVNEIEIGTKETSKPSLYSSVFSDSFTGFEEEEIKDEESLKQEDATSKKAGSLGYGAASSPDLDAKPKTTQSPSSAKKLDLKFPEKKKDSAPDPASVDKGLQVSVPSNPTLPSREIMAALRSQIRILGYKISGVETKEREVLRREIEELREELRGMERKK